MNIAVLLAGGVDPAFKMDIPKQFVNVYNKPCVYDAEVPESPGGRCDYDCVSKGLGEHGAGVCEAVSY